MDKCTPQKLNYKLLKLASKLPCGLMPLPSVVGENEAKMEVQVLHFVMSLTYLQPVFKNVLCFHKGTM